MRTPLLILLTAVAAMTWPAAALADSASSSNWAGYAVHGPGRSFHTVQGMWRQPHASCRRGRRTYSAYWVGIGGFNPRSQALEQIGTELDCRSNGHSASSAWYELVPAPSSPIRLTVRPGDLIMASVSVSGHRVTASLYDVTRRHGFAKTLSAPSVDVSSAEWIVEAPSVCINIDNCLTLPLANFRTATFDFARAVSARGHVGTISDPSWSSTRIFLMPGGRRFVVNHGGVRAGAATPSPLLSGGSSFSVHWSQVSVASDPFAGPRRAALRAGHLVHGPTAPRPVAGTRTPS